MTVGASAVSGSSGSSMDSLRIIHDASTPIRIRPAASSSPCMARKKTLSSGSGHFSDDEDEKQSRRSTGSLRDDVDWARHTFAALPSGLCEIARRSTDELYEMGSHSMPPRSAPSSLFRTSAQIEQFRAYCDANEVATENDQGGDAFVRVTNPAPDTLWIRGKAAGVEWVVLDASVERVNIDLLEHGSPATTVICKNAPNSGGFLYTKVPWGMACGDSYFLRIASAADPSRYITTGLFSIGTDP